MFLEYNWATGLFILRFGDVPTDWKGNRSFDSLEQARKYFYGEGYRLLKIDTCTWRIDKIEEKS